MIKYQPVNLKNNTSKVLVVHCADPRFQDAYKKAIASLDKYYDLIVFPGASKAVAENGSVVDSIKLLHKMHSFETIHIFDHVNCGAFGAVEDEIGSHSSCMRLAKAKIRSALPDLTIKGHLLGVDKELQLQA